MSEQSAAMAYSFTPRLMSCASRSSKAATACRAHSFV